MMGLPEYEIRIIAYKSGTAPGTDFSEKFQDDLARFILPGEFAISIKNHSPGPIPWSFEKLKLQCPHVQVAIGVRAEDRNCVITLNTPKSYHKFEDGYRTKHYNSPKASLRLFGNEDYPMIFIKPKFPDHFSSTLKRQYVDNIRTWMVISNTLGHFPKETYDGRDPIATTSVKKIRCMGNYLLKALAGDELAKEWLRKEKNKLYCSEFVHASLNLGIHYPLNKANIGEKFYESVARELSSKNFITGHPNLFAELVDLQMAPENLKPIIEEIGEVEPSPPDSIMPDPHLAIQLYTWADILATNLEVRFPSEKISQKEISRLRVEFLNEVKKDMQKLYFLKEPENSSDIRDEFENIYGKILMTIKQMGNQPGEFRQRLNPHIKTLRDLAFKIEKAVNYNIMPTCYLVSATSVNEKKKTEGILSWQYLGHGLHKNLLVCDKPSIT